MTFFPSKPAFIKPLWCLSPEKSPRFEFIWYAARTPLAKYSQTPQGDELSSNNKAATITKEQGLGFCANTAEIWLVLKARGSSWRVCGLHSSLKRRHKGIHHKKINRWSFLFTTWTKWKRRKCFVFFSWSSLILLKETTFCCLEEAHVKKLIKPGQNGTKCFQFTEYSWHRMMFEICLKFCQHDLVEIRAVGFSAENPVTHLECKFQ